MKKREFIESGRHGTYAYEFEGFNQSGVMYEYPAETPKLLLSNLIDFRKFVVIIRLASSWQ